MSWPVNNRSDSLNVDYHYIRRMVGRSMGYGYNHSAWNDEQNQEVQEAIDEGVRQYYFPPVLPQPFAVSAMEQHEWSFMRPTVEIDTVANQRKYPLPENFERLVGSLTYRSTNGDYYGPIPLVPSTRLRALENKQFYTSPPELCAIDPAPAVGDGPQTQVLELHPTPGAVYQLILQYQATALRLTEEHPWPMGGQAHGSGILASCLAAAEERILGQRGPKYAAFIERLASNVARDRQRAAQFLGHNGEGWTGHRNRADARELGRDFFYNGGRQGGSMYSR